MCNDGCIIIILIEDYVCKDIGPTENTISNYLFKYEYKRRSHQGYGIAFFSRNSGNRFPEVILNCNSGRGNV